MDELLKAIGMYQDSVSAAATTNAVNEASKYAQDINMNITDEAQKRNALQGLGNQLALHLVGTGANAGQIQAAFQAVGPKQFATPEAAMQEGILTGNQGLTKLGSTAVDAQMQRRMKELTMQEEIKNRMEDRRFAREFVIQQLKSQKDRQLSGEEIKPITEADSTLDSLDSVKFLFNQGKTEGVGIAAGRVPNRVNSWLGNDTAIQMDTELKKLQAQYVKLMTGTGVGKEERQILSDNLPSSTDSPHVFETKLNSFRTAVERIKMRTLSNYGLSGRDISGFQQQAKDQREKMKIEASIADAIARAQR